MINSTEKVVFGPWISFTWHRWPAAALAQGRPAQKKKTSRDPPAGDGYWGLLNLKSLPTEEWYQRDPNYNKFILKILTKRNDKINKHIWRTSKCANWEKIRFGHDTVFWLPCQLWYFWILLICVNLCRLTFMSKTWFFKHWNRFALEWHL